MRVIAWLANNFPEMHRGMRSMQHLFIFLGRAVKHFGQSPRSVVGLGGHTLLPEHDIFRSWFFSHASIPAYHPGCSFLWRSVYLSCDQYLEDGIANAARLTE